MLRHAALAVLVLAGSALADLQVTPSVNDQPVFYAQPGDTVLVDLKYFQTDALNPVAEPVGVEFLVLFSQPGLNYRSYTWSAGVFDFSLPYSGDLPVTLSADTYTGGSAGDVDINLQNALFSGSYSASQLVQLELEIPGDWSAGNVIISAVPVGLSDESANPLPTTGGNMTLVIPEPTSTAMLLVGLAALNSRRKP